jgi:hypothetical protein
VTISLIPYIIYKIRKGLSSTLTNVQSSNHVIVTGTRMLHKLKETFGTGMEGTASEENFTEAAKHHPKGIPVLVLMASLLDPLKGDIGTHELDKEHI